MDDKKKPRRGDTTVAQGASPGERVDWELDDLWMKHQSNKPRRGELIKPRATPWEEAGVRTIHSLSPRERVGVRAIEK